MFDRYSTPEAGSFLSLESLKPLPGNPKALSPPIDSPKDPCSHLVYTSVAKGPEVVIWKALWVLSTHSIPRQTLSGWEA